MSKLFDLFDACSEENHATKVLREARTFFENNPDSSVAHRDLIVLQEAREVARRKMSEAVSQMSYHDEK